MCAHTLLPLPSKVLSPSAVRAFSSAHSLALLLASLALLALAPRPARPARRPFQFADVNGARRKSNGGGGGDEGIY